MTKEEIKNYLKAIDDLENEYNAFRIENKYGNNTHKDQFQLLATMEGDKVSNTLGWIKNCYNCFHKNEMEKSNPFNYLRSLLKKHKIH